jgi:hypothetical protein
MKKVWVLLIASILFVSFAGVSFAQGAASAKAAPAAKAAAALTGKIVSIDTAKNQVTIEDKKKTKTTVDVDAAQIGALKVNEKVTVAFKEDGKTVESIQVAGKKK